MGHVGCSDDTAMGYRPAEELKSWHTRCPVLRLENYLLEDNPDEAPGVLASLRNYWAREIDRAVNLARRLPMPWTKLAADQSGAVPASNGHPASNADGRQQRTLTYREAITEAIEQSMELDAGVIVLGEGVAQPGYIYDTTRSLVDHFGPERVIETPIAEAALTGITLGASLAGLRPVLMHMRCDFLLVSMDQIINHIAHWYQVFGDRTPLVIRAIVARGRARGRSTASPFMPCSPASRDYGW